jgi:EAL domain-containing protein (putative c-di-GMP-specific phosphodiesterase class I)
MSDGNGAADADAIREVVNGRQVRVVFQPLVDLQTGQTFAYECLVRSTSPHFKSPPALFDAAAANDCAGALGRIIREMAIVECADHPLFLNIHPNEFDEGWLVRPDDPIFLHEHPVYLEITESVPLSHFTLCDTILKEVRGKGINLVVDDLGAGYSNLKYIADLAPEVVKLDRQLIVALHESQRLLALVGSIVRLCEDMGATVVAEGIETMEELRAVASTGAHYAQGYFLARPAHPPPEVDPALARDVHA